MPEVEICSKAGRATFSYTISTPSSSNADCIDPSIPTILFLHPVYVARVAFHTQFAEPSIRRFNLVAPDFRAHGQTKGGVPLDYNTSYMADDIYHFMEALKLPACHFFGISMGSSVALQLSIERPEKVLSLFLVSPLPFVENELVASGRQEIFDCWAEGSKNDPTNLDLATQDAVFGAMDFGFNRSDASIVQAIVKYTLPEIIRVWTAPGQAALSLKELHATSVGLFVNGQPHTAAEFAKVTCPVHLLHCGGDLAYPIETVEEIKNLFEEAGKTDVQLSQVPDAPHFGSVTHSGEFNALFAEWLSQHHTSGDLPPVNPSVVSPFQEDLVKLGLEDDLDSEDGLVPV